MHRWSDRNLPKRIPPLDLLPRGRSHHIYFEGIAYKCPSAGYLDVSTFTFCCVTSSLILFHSTTNKSNFQNFMSYAYVACSTTDCIPVVQTPSSMRFRRECRVTSENTGVFNLHCITFVCISCSFLERSRPQ